MSVKHTSVRTRTADVPYHPKRRNATAAFWATATPHMGLKGWRAALAQKPEEDRKAQTALRVGNDVRE